MPRKTLILIGIFLVLVQLSGVPHLWKTFVGVVAGIILVIIAIRDSREDSRPRIFSGQSEKELMPDSSSESRQNVDVSRDNQKIAQE